MKRLILLLFLVAALVAALGLSLHAQSDNEATARKLAHDLAGAFANDGFKLRDGYWGGPLEVGKPQLLEVNLYAGNQYWFSVAASGPGRKLAITVYDEAGRPMSTDPYHEDGKAAAGFSPETSGPYYIKVEEITGDSATFCLIYSYK